MNYLGDHTGSLQPLAADQRHVPHPSKAVSYSVALSDFKSLLDRAGHPGRLFGEHSNKRGGATHAANCGVPCEEIRELGNWKNVQTAQLYIDESTPNKQKRNQVMQNLI